MIHVIKDRKLKLHTQYTVQGDDDVDLSMDPSKAVFTISGFECEFVEQPKELPFECPVCLFVLRDPYNTSCCDHSFCRGCIEQIKTSGNPFCPLCKQKFETHPHNWLQRALNQLEVYCTYRNKGCEWIGPLRQLDKHLNCDTDADKLTNGCGFVPLRCQACNESVPRKGYGVHISNLCEQRPFSCEYCGEYDSKYLDVINNHWLWCPCYPVECVNECGARPKRKDLEQHISDECLLMNIPCGYCSVHVLRRDMHKHLAANLITHISLMVDEKLDGLHQQALEADEKIHDLRQENQYLQDDVEKLRLQIGKNKEEISGLREDNLETQSLYSEMRQQNIGLTKNYDDLQENYKGLQKDYDGLCENYEDLKQENNQLQAKVKQLSDDIELTKKEREFRAGDDRRHKVAINVKQGSCREYVSTSSQSDSDSSQASGEIYRPGPVRHSTRQDEQPSIPPVVLKMSNYSSYLKWGGTWESEPFYSDRQPSYKLCLSVRASRSGNLSVYIRLKRGDYDDQLDWPFDADITTRLINHGGGNDWERKILFRDGHRVTKRDTVGEARGESNFIALYENSSFIKNNTLWFEVLSVKHKEYRWR